MCFLEALSSAFVSFKQKHSFVVKSELDRLITCEIRGSEIARKQNLYILKLFLISYECRKSLLFCVCKYWNSVIKLITCFEITLMSSGHLINNICDVCDVFVFGVLLQIVSWMLSSFWECQCFVQIFGNIFFVFGKLYCNWFWQILRSPQNCFTSWKERK